MNSFLAAKVVARGRSSHPRKRKPELSKPCPNGSAQVEAASSCGNPQPANDDFRRVPAVGIEGWRSAAGCRLQRSARFVAFTNNGRDPRQVNSAWSRPWPCEERRTPARSGIGRDGSCPRGWGGAPSELLGLGINIAQTPSGCQICSISARALASPTPSVSRRLAVEEGGHPVGDFDQVLGRYGRPSLG
jgi:hypothetical protein